MEVKWSTLDITPNWAKLVSYPVYETFDELTLYNVGGHESSCVVVAVELTASQVALDLKQVRIYDIMKILHNIPHTTYVYFVFFP